MIILISTFSQLKLDLSTTKAKTKEEIDFKFTTKSKSKIYLLAFDKRLKSLRDGNDMTKADVVQSVADYDGENRILIDDLSSWAECTPEEIERVQKGRTFISQHSKDRYRVAISDNMRKM